MDVRIEITTDCDTSTARQVYHVSFYRNYDLDQFCQDVAKGLREVLQTPSQASEKKNAAGD